MGVRCHRPERRRRRIGDDGGASGAEPCIAHGDAARCRGLDPARRQRRIEPPFETPPSAMKPRQPAIGVAQAALDTAIRYAVDRKQFGKPIAEFQGLQFMMADMAMQIEAARSLLYEVTTRYDRGEMDGYGGLSAMVKTLASDAAMKVTTDAVQILGGYGYMKEFPVERMMRDAKVTQIFEGTNQIQRMLIARDLLK